MLNYTCRHFSGNVRASALVIALISIIPLAAQQRPAAGKSDPFIGQWSMDLTKSEFTPGPAPATRNMDISPGENSIKLHIHDSGGFIDELTNYEIYFDGKDHPVDPGMRIDTYAAKRVDANSIECTGKVRGMAAETATYKISPDGKTVTITVQAKDYSNKQVFTRL
jgi:hypothetical protein